MEYVALWHQTPCKDVSVVLHQMMVFNLFLWRSRIHSCLVNCAVQYDTACIQSSDFFETGIVYEKEIEEQFFCKICPLKTSLVELWLSPCLWRFLFWQQSCKCWEWSEVCHFRCDDHSLKIQLIKVRSAWKVKGSGLFFIGSSRMNI